jgi:peptidoglycan/xylan/chitin deacetylase (PgdA/CDA1 family)
MLQFTSPTLLPKLLPQLLWRREGKEKIIYLTFDDGPTPVVTDFVLDKLNEYNAKATFFCIGNNIKKYPDIFERIKHQGHTIGNHTFNHMKGWKTKNTDYFTDIEATNNLTGSMFFRPPYGKIKLSQIKALKKDYKIVMWDVLSRDFDQSIDKNTCLTNVINHAKPGSIVVFHDSLKAKDKLYFTLPRVLKHFSQKNYIFEKL